MNTFTQPTFSQVVNPAPSICAATSQTVPFVIKFPDAQSLFCDNSQKTPKLAESQLNSSLYRKKSHEKLRHCAFSPEEDANLRKLISEHGDTNWQIIALSMYRRSARQCRERWNVLKKREESKRPWMEEEDCLLVQKCIELGPKWNKIELFFEGRDSQSLKCRWRYLTRNAEIDSLKMSEQSQLKSEDEQVEAVQEQNGSNSCGNSSLFYESNSQVSSIQSGYNEASVSNNEENGQENFDFAFWDFMNGNNEDNTDELFSFCW